MDAIELLARENEFKRLNQQLEKKTKSLMKEIEHVMQKQDFFTEFSPSLSLPTKQNFKKHCCTPPSLPDTPIKRNFKKKTLKAKKVESPKTLESDDSEFGCETPDGLKNYDSDSQHFGKISRNSQHESKTLNKNENNSDLESQVLNKNRQNSDLESQVLSKNKRNSDLESQVLNKNRRNSELESKAQTKRKNEGQNKVVCDCCPHNTNTLSNEIEFIYAFVTVNVKDKVLPPLFLNEDRVTVESVCKFLSSKIKLMQEQIDKLQSTIEKKATQCESHLTQLAELESERMSLLNKTNNMKCSTADMRAKYLATQKRLDEKDKLYKELRSETDKQSSELKRLKSKNSSVEAKCASQEQLVDSLRQQLEICKRSEKEHRDSARQLSLNYDSAISRLEQQIASLTTRGDKQAALIRNLRKQNALLATEGAVQALNVEYAGFLNQDF